MEVEQVGREWYQQYQILTELAISYSPSRTLSTFLGLHRQMFRYPEEASGIAPSSSKIQCALWWCGCLGKGGKE